MWTICRERGKMIATFNGIKLSILELIFLFL